MLKTTTPMTRYVGEEHGITVCKQKKRGNQQQRNNSRKLRPELKQANHYYALHYSYTD